MLGGPVVGGAIAQGAAWEWIFWLNVPSAWRRSRWCCGASRRATGAGRGSISRASRSSPAAALGIVWALVRGNAAGWGSVEVLGALAAGIVLAIAFVAWELRAPEPMLPMGFFRSRGFAAGNASVFFLIASLFGAAFFLAQFLQTSLGYGPLGTGLRLMPWTATLFIVAPIAGSLVNRVGERPLIVGGLLLQAIGMAWIGLIASPSMDYVDMVPALVVAGTGVSMAIPATQNVVMSAVPATEAGKASGTYNMLRQLGGVFGIALLVAVFTGAGGYASPQAFTQRVRARDRRDRGAGADRRGRRTGAAPGRPHPPPPGRGGDVMRRVVVRYRVRPDRVEENERLVRAVYEELAAVQPEGLRYATVKLDDGVTFVHVAVHETENPLPGLASFRAFTEGVAERCDEPPVVSTAELVGSYRLLELERRPRGVVGLARRVVDARPPAGPGGRRHPASSPGHGHRRVRGPARCHPRRPPWARRLPRLARWLR